MKKSEQISNKKVVKKSDVINYELDKPIKEYFSKINDRNKEKELFWKLFNYVTQEREALLEYGIIRGFCTPEGFNVIGEN